MQVHSMPADAIPRREDTNNWEKQSNASVASGSRSITGMLGRTPSLPRTPSLAGLRKNSKPFAFRSSSSGASKRTGGSDLSIGDQCETVSWVTMRREESKESEFVADFPAGTSLEVLGIGDPPRIKVKAHNAEGWVSRITKLKEPLVVKISIDSLMNLDDLEVGGMHQVKCRMLMRETECIDSCVTGELLPGSLVRILERSLHNRRRARVNVERVGDGWIDLVTMQGESVVGKVDPQHAGKPASAGAKLKKEVQALLSAAISGDLVGVKKVVNAGTGLMAAFGHRVDLNSSDIRGKTALMYAAAFGHFDVAQFLIAKGVNVNASDDTYRSALHHACRRANGTKSAEQDALHGEIVKLLLHHGADVEARDHNGCTPLMFAVSNSITDGIAITILNAGAELNIRDYHGNTPMDYAFLMGNGAIIELLRKRGAMELPAGVDGEYAGASAGASESGEAKKAKAAVAVGGVAIASSGKVKKDKKDKKDDKDDKKPDKDDKKVKKDKSDKPEKGDKPKKVPGSKKRQEEHRKSQNSIMLLARAAPEENSPEVHVQSLEQDPKERELEKLALLLRQPQSVTELEAAIQAARSHGAGDKDVADAEKAVEKLRKASQSLRGAIDSKDVKELKSAIKKAKECKVPDSEIAQAQQVLDAEMPKQAARDKLTTAKSDGNIDRLRVALEEAKTLGLPESELEEFNGYLEAAKSREDAEAALVAATDQRIVDKLKFAILQAEKACVSSRLIQKAQAVLQEEEPKERAREVLAAACSTRSVEELKAAIAKGREAKLTDADLSEAAHMLEEEEEKEKQLAQVIEVLREVESVPNDVDAIRGAKDKLSKAIEDALQAGVAEASLATADQRRKKLHNMVEDLKGSIRVYCRVRPLSSKEKDQGDTNVAQALDTLTVELQGQAFQFDSVWTPGTQEEVFEDCRDLVQSAVDGYNVTMFAYGQTGAGKTFTMYGVPGMLGTAPRTIDEVFRVTEKGKDRFDFTILGSMMELYNSELVDLLVPIDNPKSKNKKLNVRLDKNNVVVVEHLIDEECQSASQLMEALERGNAQRTVAATAMNSESSRSHLVFVIKIVSVNKETKAQLRGKILLVDLAGSERLKKSQVEAHMQKEAIEINKSLTALGDVIEALTRGEKKNVPYRNHKLTQLMQDSLGGTAKTLMFVNCSPASSNVDETLMSLKYATRAKKITNQAAKKA